MKYLAICAAVFALGGCVTTAPKVQNSTDQPITVVKHGMNVSALGGYSYRGYFYNTSPRVMKYVDFYVVPMNAVGDPVEDGLTGKSTTGLRYTGFIGPGGAKSGSFDGARWYNDSIKCVKVEKIEITYLDDTTETIRGKRLALATAGVPTCAGIS